LIRRDAKSFEWVQNIFVFIFIAGPAIRVLETYEPLPELIALLNFMRRHPAARISYNHKSHRRK
jgi:hypothetical protein